jgi:Chaperone of endosialidase
MMLEKIRMRTIIRSTLPVLVFLGLLALSARGAPPPNVVESDGERNTAMGSFSLFNLTTGVGNTAAGYLVLAANTDGTGNTAVGNIALSSNESADYNTALGYAALSNNSMGNRNAAVGSRALQGNQTGNDNSALGHLALHNNLTGLYNTALGSNALLQNSTGYRNVALGYRAGHNITTGADNIMIGAGQIGNASDKGVIRIGSRTFQSKAFIAGVRGVTTGRADAVPVVIDANGQLGTINSSRRFKQDIQPMGSVSERLYALEPVTFRYKDSFQDGSRPIQVGLIAEDVARVFPELVVLNEKGEPETVAYHLLSSLLLNELQKQRVTIESQASRIAALESQATELAELRSELARIAALVDSKADAQLVATTR